MASASHHIDVAVDASPPTSNLEAILVICLALVFVLFCSGTAALVGRYRRRAQAAHTYVRRAWPPAPTPVMVDLEQQACTSNGTDTGKNSPRFLAFPPLAVLARSWSASSASGSPTLSKHSMELPPPALAVAPSSRLRDSVLCKVLGQLTWPSVDNDKIAKVSSRRIVDVEAAPGNLDSQNVPEWIRPHLAQINEQSKREWTLYTPTPAVVVPEIVIQSCGDELVPDTPGSTYSTDSTPSELDTPPPMTPTLSSPVSFYFPASPSFSVREYLQVPSPSFHAPREEAKPVMRNVSNFSGKTFALATPVARFSKLRERRMLAQAQAVNIVVDDQSLASTIQITAMGHQVVKGRGSGPRVSQSLGMTGTAGTAQVSGTGVAGVGLGFQLRPQLDFQDIHNTLATSGFSGDDADHRLSGTFSCAYTGLASVLEDTFAADVALSTAAASQDGTDVNIRAQADANVNILVSASSDGDGTDKGRPERLARLIDAFDSSFSLASADSASDSGHGGLCDILDDYHYDHYDEYLDSAHADESAINEIVVHETNARHAVVVFAV